MLAGADGDTWPSETEDDEEDEEDEEEDEDSNGSSFGEGDSSDTDDGAPIIPAHGKSCVRLHLRIVAEAVFVLVRLLSRRTHIHIRRLMIDVQPSL